MIACADDSKHDRVVRVGPLSQWWSLVALLLALQSASSEAQTPPLSQTGRWQGPYFLGAPGDAAYQGAHVAVLKGPVDPTGGGGDTTRTLLWGQSGLIGVWSFVPKTSLTIPQTADPEPPDPTTVNFHGVFHPGQDLFCSGHAHVKGRLVVVGGQYGVVGLEKPHEFNPLYSDPDNPAATPRAWQQLASTRVGRWYPSATSLSTGRLLASSGTKFGYQWTFGGSTGSIENDLRPIGMGNIVEWTNPTGFIPPQPPPATWDPPSERKDHTAIMNDHKPLQHYFKHMVVFGGQTGPDQIPPASTLKSNEVWAQYLNPDDTTSHWKPYGTVGGPPAPRSRHTAIYYAPTSGNPIMVVYGGRDEAGNALGDVWKLELNPPTGSVGLETNTGTWTQLLASSGSDDGVSGPGNRYGHTAIFDEGPNGNSPRMLVFGGRTSATTLASTTVWSLNLTGTPQWALISTSGDAPPAREGHGAVGDVHAFDQQYRFRMVIFGGHDGSQALGDTWSLWRLTSADIWTWMQALPPIGDPVPQPRSRHAMSRDRFWDRAVVFGGDGGPGLRNDLWILDLSDNPTNTPRWSLASVLNPSEAPAPRAGHTIAPDSRQIVERVPERFDPNVVPSPPGQPYPGAWAPLDSAATDLQYNLYPFMFTLPSGNVLDAGPLSSTRVLKANNWTWDPPITATYDEAGSAVMYRPGSVLRCGRIGVDGRPTVSNTDTIRFSGPNDSNAEWTAVAAAFGQLFPRKFHNLTVLPTGDVLVTGGLAGENLASAEKRPQAWKRSTATWSSNLAADPAVRNYHSAAILLPDGRVLSAGGEKTATTPPEENPHRDHATIFEPPYLFTGNADAERPVIATAPCRIGYGEEFFIGTPDAASMVGGTVCLIRPGAVTHGFNQDQRYVPLDIYECEYSGRLRVVAPVDGGIAPPGDYLLFIVKPPTTINPAGVPSIGKWVRVGPDVPPGCDGDVPNRVNAPDPTVEIYSTTQIWFYWTAPGDDDDPPLSGPTGTVAEYDLRSSTGPLGTSEDAFCHGWPGVVQNPLSGAGEPQYGWVSGLAPCTQYRFALKARDEAHNWSPTSNEVIASTLCGWGGGGGGGLGAQPGGTLLGAVSAPGGETDGGASPPGPATNDESEPLGLATPSAGAWAVEMGLSDDAPAWSIYALSDDEALSLFAGDSAGILVQGPEAQGGRPTRARLFPAASSAHFALRRLRQPGRLVFRGKYEFRQAWGSVATGTEGEAYDVVSARHSRLGDQTAVMDLAGSTTAALAPGDTLNLNYRRSRSGADGAEDWFMLIGEPGSVAPIAGNRRALPPEAPTLPAEYALHANQPNPFSRLTTVRFSLPSSQHVRLEVFDLLGRRVRTLAEGSFEAGVHAIQWDGRDAQGVLLSAGVYVTRIHAGEFRARRTMVLLP